MDIITVLIIIGGIAFACAPLTWLVGRIACMNNPESRFKDMAYRNKIQKRIFYICIAIQIVVIITLLIVGRKYL